MSRIMIVVIALCVACPSASAAVAVTHVPATIGNYPSGEDCTITSFDASTGSPNLILLAIALENGFIQIPPIFETPGGGQQFKQIGFMIGTNNEAELWVYQLGPTNFTQGTAPIAIHLSGASGCVSAAVAFSGVSSLGTPVTNSCSTGCSTAVSVTGITSPGTGGVVYDALVASDPNSATAGLGQTEEWNCSSGSMTCSNGKVLGAGSVSGPATSASWMLTSHMTRAWATMAVPLIPTSTTAVRIGSFAVRHYKNGNLIELRTGHEISSLGFNLYRGQNDQRVRLNSSLLAGTALLAGPHTSLTSGYTHTWLDRAKATETGAAYWAEEVDLDGTKTMFGPAYAEVPADSKSPALSPLVAEGFEEAVLKPQLLNELGKALPAQQQADSPYCGPVNSGSQPFQRTEGQPAITHRAEHQQYALAAGPAMKISVCAEGWYRLTQDQLISAGFDPGVNPKWLQLYADGVEQPILVHADGNRLEPQDSIEFYGYPLDTTWSGTQVYWLVAGSKPGKRVVTEPVESNGLLGPASFPATVVWRPRSLYFAALLNGDADNFFGPVISTSPVQNPLTVTHLARFATTGAHLRVLLQGVSSGNHAVGVELNSHHVGTVNFRDQQAGSATLDVPLTALQEGSGNILTFTAQGGDQDVSAVNTVQLTYPHTYTADGEYLRLTLTGGEKQTIDGFTSSRIRVMDITAPDSVMVVPGVISQEGATFSITIAPRGQGARTLLAFVGNHSEEPLSLTSNVPSHWHDAGYGADVVIIAHRDFLPSVETLRILRERQGHVVATVDVQELFDEFNFGAKSPYALKKFLQTAEARWQVKPRFVLLVGDATFDPRNYLGVGDYDFVPTYLVDTQYLETASDDWFADFSLQNLPAMAIGRLPVRSSEDARMLANRIVGYETASSGAWTTQVLLVAGIDDPVNPFTSYIADVQKLIPPNQEVSVISQGSDPDAHNNLITALNDGQVLVNYDGHGSDQVWADGLLSSADAGNLTNGSQTPFVISMTCLNGYFQDVYTVSLAKAIMLARSGGAVAAWASSGLTDSAPQAKLDQAMVQTLFGNDSITLGEAAMLAKQAVNDRDVRRTWILLGDPATKLQISKTSE